MEGPVAIVGYMGRGKTTVGRILARTLGWELVDLDRAIAKEVGRGIPEIFAHSGEEHFRDLEQRALLSALDGAGERVAEVSSCVTKTVTNSRKL